MRSSRLHKTGLGLLVLSSALFGSPHVTAQSSPQLEATVMDLGQPWSVRLRGQPGARFGLVLDTRVAGPHRTRLGELCVDLGAGFRVLVDGLSQPGPRIGDNGRFVWTATIPARESLLGTTCAIQAIVRDRTSPKGVALSNCLHRTIGNGSAGDYRRRVVDLEWPYSERDFPLYFAGDLDVGDFDRDGDVDIVVAARRTGDHPRQIGGELRLYLNDGAGNFVDATAGRVPVPIDDADAHSVEAEDIDSDGDLDLVSIAGNAILGRGQAHLYLNDGSGNFLDGTFGTDTRLPPEAASYYAWNLALADIENDGDPDIILDGRPARVWLNTNGRGLFVDTEGTPDVRIFETQSFESGVSIGDVDGDLFVDVLLKNANAQPVLLLNDEQGYFRPPLPEDLAGLPDLKDRMSARDSMFVDFDSDGDLDLFIASGPLPGGASQDRLLINSNGRGRFLDGTFGPDTGIPLRQDVSSGFAAGDIDRDGDIDLVVDAGGQEGDQLLLNNGLALFGDASSSQRSGLPILWEVNDDIELVDFDGDGDLDVAMIFTRPVEGRFHREGVKILFNE